MRARGQGAMAELLVGLPDGDGIANLPFARASIDPQGMSRATERTARWHHRPRLALGEPMTARPDGSPVDGPRDGFSRPIPVPELDARVVPAAVDRLVAVDPAARAATRHA